MIAKTLEKYIAVTKSLETSYVKFQFLDTFQFLPTSLDTLASILPNEEKHILRQNFPDPIDFHLLTKKGLYMYDWVDSVEKYEYKELPPKEAFYSRLNESSISDENYAHCQKVWSHFRVKNIAEYTDLYMKCDILLLADVFIAFRNACIYYFKCDPCHYVSLPSYSFDAFLYYLKVNLKLIHVAEIYAFLQRSIRGGLTHVFKRYHESNNKYMGEKYDPSKPESYILYLDVNNMYGGALSEALPYDEFEFVNTLPCNIHEIAADSDQGYIFEVDLHYPESVHDFQRELPLCPENSVPPSDSKACKRLMATLQDKKNYVIHYRALQQALKYGVQVTRVHRILRFKQAAFLKGYIDLNTRLRQKATDNFHRSLYKLLSYSI